MGRDGPVEDDTREVVRMDVIELHGGRARAVVTPVAAMILDAAFDVDGVEHRPFARAPWIGEAGLEGQPGHLRVLGAEFVAVPFGASGAPAELDPAWHGLVPADAPERQHGPSADDAWSIVERTVDSVTLALDYSEPYGISRLERTVSIRPDAAALDLELVLHARRPVDTAVGLHPILRLPTEARALTLAVDFADGYTFPGPVWPGSGPTRPGQTFRSLDAVPARPDGTLDLSALPLDSPVEEIVLLAGANSPVEAHFADTGTRVVLDWDRTIIPNVMLWVSDGVLQEEPWLGRYRGLGVEPIAAAFDFPESVSIAPNPLSRAGHATSVHVEPGSPVRVTYSVEVSSIAL